MQLVEITRGRKYDSPARVRRRCCAALAIWPPVFTPAKLRPIITVRRAQLPFPNFVLARILLARRRNLRKEPARSPRVLRLVVCRRACASRFATHTRPRRIDPGRARDKLSRPFIFLASTCFARRAPEYFGATARDLSPREREEGL